ncbi:response regulator [Desulfobacterales bacterium HSG17]|nr:response regulator [Desulfobacterales bacterium HSG17]
MIEFLNTVINKMTNSVFVGNEQQGHTVIEARNGREAVDAFQRETHDFILMDVHMPEMDGLSSGSVEDALCIR